MRRTLKSLAVAGVLVLLLAGCVGSNVKPEVDPSPLESPTATVPPAPTEAAERTDAAESTDTAEPTPPEQFTAIDPAVYTKTPALGRSYVEFVSPSRNIACGIFDYDDGGIFWGCEPKEYTYPTPPARSEGCHSTGGIEVTMEQPAHWGCRTDEPFSGTYDDTVPVLPYGSSLTALGVTCTSRADEVTCQDESGQGFDMSRTEANIW